MAEDFDIERTMALRAALAHPKSRRLRGSPERLTDLIRYASLTAFRPQIELGPDGFHYFHLALPTPDTPFEAFSVNSILRHCTEVGLCGVAIFANEDRRGPPAWRYTLGDLWSLRLWDRLDGDPEDWQPTAEGYGHWFDGKPREIVYEDRRIWAGLPTADFLPAPMARAMGDFIEHRLGWANPAVSLAIDPLGDPRRNVTLDIPAGSFASEAECDRALQALAWFLPRSRRLITRPDGLPDSVFRPMLDRTADRRKTA